jgi:hypothetical protein
MPAYRFGPRLGYRLKRIRWSHRAANLLDLGDSE